MPTLPRTFVMGHPIAHSRSPMLHNYWMEQLGIKGSYERLDIPPAELDSFFAGYRHAGWIGGNVTVPHKTTVIPFLDRIDGAAQKMGAVNTIWWEDDTLVGGNTDALGFTGNIDELRPGWDMHAERAVVIGAGGAARAAIHGLIGRGLTVALCNRTLEKADTLAKHFGRGVTAHTYGKLPDLMRECDILVNTTSLGMIGQPSLDIDLDTLKADAIVYDVVYVPLETDLLESAKVRGHRTVDGLGMLLHQGVAGFRRWYGKTPRLTAELRKMISEDIIAKTPVA